MDARNLQWKPFIAKCSMCFATVREENVVLGRQHPLAPNEHFCPDCAKSLRIVEYDASGNLIRSHYVTRNND